MQRLLNVVRTHARRRVVVVALACFFATLLLGVWGASDVGAADAPTVGLRYPSLSPDNRHATFAWRGDIWYAPADGQGPARRLTIHEAQDTLPRLSPDGSQVAFSSRRNGGYDLFLVSIEGGMPKQLTFHGGPAILCDWSPDGKRLLFMAGRDPSLEGMDLYEVDLAGGTPRRVTSDGGREGAYHPNGKSIVYARGFNTIYQDNYEGSANYDLYVVSEPGALPRRLTDTPGNERHPFFSTDGKTVYFVAEEKGVANFYALPAEGGARRQVTSFKDDVWRPDLGWDGKTVIFEQNGRLLTCDLEEKDPKPRSLPISVQSDVRHSGIEVRTLTTGPDQVDISPDGARLVFTVHGDLWTMPASGGEGARLTSTKQKEEWPRFSPDGKKIAYQSEQGGNSDLWLLDLATKKTSQVTDHRANDFYHAWSPDGTKLVFTSERTGNRDIWVLDIDSGALTQITNHAAADDDPVFSPDGRWIAFDSGREGAQAIYVVPAEGGEARRITQGTANFQVPHYSPDGSMIVFEAFNQATTGSGGLYVVSAHGGPHVQLTRDGSGAVWSPNGEWIYYTVRGRGGETQIFRHPAPTSIDMSERVHFTGRVEVDLREELGDLFDECWEQLRDGFYDPEMHGVTWDEMRKKYRPLAVDAEIKEEFQNVIRQMLAELGASHLGIAGGEETDSIVRPKVVETGLLGCELDPTPTSDGGRRVVSVVPRGPADQAGLRVGDVVVGLAGKPLKADTNLDRLLAGTAGKETALAFRPVTADGLGSERRQSITPASWGALSGLLYRNWVEDCAETVKAKTKGTVGYVHLSRMDGENLSRFQQAVSRWNRSERIQGMVLDVRNNGGGNIHQQLMEILMARPFMRLKPRNARERITQPALYWDKPVVLLINERSFSDAEVFPYAFRTAGLGKVVGMPTAGGVIGTNDITLSDGSTFRIPRVGWWGMDNQKLEGAGVQPDIRIEETPEDRRAGRDPQLDKAIEVLRAEIQAAKQAAPTAKPSADPAKPTTPEPPKPKPETTPPPRPEPVPPSEGASARNPLADAEVGEWVRYRIAFGGQETVLRLEVAEVDADRVAFRQTVEKGGEFLPPLPQEAGRAPLLEQLASLGQVSGSQPATVEVEGHAAEALRVALEWQGTPVVLVLTNAIPALGLYTAEVAGERVLEALAWSEPGGADAAQAPPPPVPSPPAEPLPETPGPGGAGDAASPIANPLADAVVGEWIRVRRLGREGEMLVTLEVVEVGEEQVTIVAKSDRDGEEAVGPPLQRPRTGPVPLPGRGGAAESPTWARDAVVVNGASLDCWVVTVTTRRGRTAKRWISLEVPVDGLVREERDGTVVRELVAWGTGTKAP